MKKKPSAIEKGNQMLQAQRSSFAKSVRAIDFAPTVHQNRKTGDQSSSSSSQQTQQQQRAPVNLTTISNVPTATVNGRLYQIIDFLKVSPIC
jgi:hypothetical protein